MERIKEAIKKAKAQREILAEPEAVEESVLANVTTPEESLEKLTYKNTPTIKLDSACLERHRIVALNKNEPASWAFDLLRTQVLQKMEENNWRTLAIVSPTPETGKTVVAINLAIGIAQQTNKTAMLIDFDLRRPKVGEYLGLPMEKSLNDFFKDEATLSDVMVNPEIPRLVVLPTKSPVPKSSRIS